MDEIQKKIYDIDNKILDLKNAINHLVDELNNILNLQLKLEESNYYDELDRFIDSFLKR